MSPVEKFDLAAWNRVLSLNLTAGFLLSKALLPAMLTKVGAWGQLWATAVRVLVVGRCMSGSAWWACGWVRSASSRALYARLQLNGILTYVCADCRVSAAS